MKRPLLCLLSVLVFGCSSDDKTSGSGTPDAGEKETFLGVCEECDMATQEQALADGDVEDCGEVALGDDVGPARACAQAAYAEKRGFRVIVDIDAPGKTVQEGWLYAGDKLIVLNYESNICGGDPVCGEEGCGPQVFRTDCEGPSTSAQGTAIFSCGSRTNRRKTCGPCVTMGTNSTSCQPIAD